MPSYLCTLHFMFPKQQNDFQSVKSTNCMFKNFLKISKIHGFKISRHFTSPDIQNCTVSFLLLHPFTQEVNSFISLKRTEFLCF